MSHKNKNRIGNTETVKVVDSVMNVKPEENQESRSSLTYKTLKVDICDLEKKSNLLAAQGYEIVTLLSVGQLQTIILAKLIEIK